MFDKAADQIHRSSSALLHRVLQVSVESMLRGINPMTVSKAYSMLEQVGVVVRRPGIGMVVSDTGANPAEAIDDDARTLVQTAKQVGLSRRELVARINKIWEEEWIDQPIRLRRSR